MERFNRACVACKVTTLLDRPVERQRIGFGHVIHSLDSNGCCTGLLAAVLFGVVFPNFWRRAWHDAE